MLESERVVSLTLCSDQFYSTGLINVPCSVFLSTDTVHTEFIVLLMEAPAPTQHDD